MIAARIDPPWPRELALIDMKYWEHRIQFGQAKRIPGRPALRARWGWTDHAVRSLLRAEEWKNDTPVASGSPADRQPVASVGVIESGSTAIFASPSPADRQPISTARVQETEIKESYVALEKAPEIQVWEHWRDIEVDGRKPHGRAKVLRAIHAGNVRRRIADTSTADCVLVIDYAHDPASGYWPYGCKAWCLGTLMRPKHFDRLLEEARRWRDQTGGRASSEWSAVLQAANGDWRDRWPAETEIGRIHRAASKAIGQLAKRDRGGRREAEIRRIWQDRLDEHGG